MQDIRKFVIFIEDSLIIPFIIFSFGFITARHADSQPPLLQSPLEHPCNPRSSCLNSRLAFLHLNLLQAHALPDHVQHFSPRVHAGQTLLLFRNMPKAPTLADCVHEARMRVGWWGARRSSCWKGRRSSGVHFLFHL